MQILRTKNMSGAPEGWLPIHQEYFDETKHLTTVQRGAYLLLIAHCWQHKRLPADQETRAAIARCAPAEWQDIRAEVEAFFLPDGTHERIPTD